MFKEETPKQYSVYDEHQRNVLCTPPSNPSGLSLQEKRSNNTQYMKVWNKLLKVHWEEKKKRVPTMHYAIPFNQANRGPVHRD